MCYIIGTSKIQINIQPRSDQRRRYQCEFKRCICKQLIKF
nr:MAG TPA: hypothetical protein [Caudoviricetes sp.]